MTLLSSQTANVLANLVGSLLGYGVGGLILWLCIIKPISILLSKKKGGKK